MRLSPLGTGLSSLMINQINIATYGGQQVNQAAVTAP